MLVPKKHTWLRIILYTRGTPIRDMWRRWLVVTLTAVVITYLEVSLDFFHLELTIVPFSLVGLALSIFLGFRNNASYDRFWEGRKLWGKLVNNSRTIAREHQMLIGAVPERDGGDPNAATESEIREIQKHLTYTMMGYVHSLRLHLRGQKQLDELAPFLAPELLERLEDSQNRPITILEHMGAKYRELWQRGLVHVMHLPRLEACLEINADVQGGCERILKTPVPYAYTVLLHRIVAVYCFMLPFGLVQSLGMVTPAVVAFVAYAFLGLDALGDSLEEPFGFDDGDLPLTQLSRMIEINLRQNLGETELPPQIVAVNDVLP
jgi:putative membrane protein